MSTLHFQQKEKKDQPSQDPERPAEWTSLTAFGVSSYDCKETNLKLIPQKPCAGTNEVVNIEQQQ